MEFPSDEAEACNHQRKHYQALTGYPRAKARVRLTDGKERRGRRWPCLR